MLIITDIMQNKMLSAVSIDYRLTQFTRLHTSVDLLKTFLDCSIMRMRMC